MLGGVNINPQLCNSQHTFNRLGLYFKKFYNIIINLVSKVEKDDELLNNKIQGEFNLNISKTAKWILLMLFAGGNIRKFNEPISGRIRLLKEIFLFIKQAKIKNDIYDFRAYKYGPFANEFLEDLNFLKGNKYISEKEGFGGLIYQLTPDGMKLANNFYSQLDENLKRRLFGIKIRFNDVPLNDLLEYIYSMYPEYAINSEYFSSNLEGV